MNENRNKDDAVGIIVLGALIGGLYLATKGGAVSGITGGSSGGGGGGIGGGKSTNTGLTDNVTPKPEGDTVVSGGKDNLANNTYGQNSTLSLSDYASLYGANPDSVAQVYSLSNYVNEETDMRLGAAYNTYLNTPKTVVKDMYGNDVSVGDKVSPVVGIGNTIAFYQTKGMGLSDVPDSNALAVAGIKGAAVAGGPQDEAGAWFLTSLAKWFDSPYQSDESKRSYAASLGLSWSPNTGLTAGSGSARTTAPNTAATATAAATTAAAASVSKVATATAAGGKTTMSTVSTPPTVSNAVSVSRPSRGSTGSSGGGFSSIVGPSTSSGVYVTSSGGKTGTATNIGSELSSLRQNVSKSSSSGSSSRGSSSSGSSSRGSSSSSRGSSSSSRGSSSSGSSSWSGGGGGKLSGVTGSGKTKGGGSYVTVG